MNEHPSMDQVLLDRLNDAIEANLQNEQFGVTELATESGLSKSQLNRKLTDLTRQSASQFIRESRLKKALDLLRDNAATTSEVSYMVGFGSPSYFSTCFHDYFGFPPSEARIRNSNEKKARPFNLYIIGLIILCSLVLLTLSYYSYRFITTTTTGVENNKLSLQKSIAVLAFDDMSSEGDQEYFCDGISEEIINSLARIKELKVIGRSSSFQFKGENPDYKEIGEKLNVSHILDGSVRKSGSMIRINVQLINAADGAQIWSQPFDREMGDIFKIQDEISASIAAQMKVSMGLIKRHSIDLELYDLYLRARTLLHQRGPGVELSLQLFEQIIEQDSLYLPAWTGLAQAWIVMPLYGSKDFPTERRITLPNALSAAEKALSLDPSDPEALAAMATIFREKRKYGQAYDYFKKAVAVNGNSAVILEDYVQFLLQMGYVDEALSYGQKIIDLDPLTPLYLVLYSATLKANGFNQEAIQALKNANHIDPNLASAVRVLIFSYLNIDQIDSALYVLENYLLPERIKVDYKRQLEAVKGGNLDYVFGPRNILYFAMNELNQQDEMLKVFQEQEKNEFTHIGYFPIYAQQGLTYHAERFISDPRMKEVIRNFGLVDFWKEHGWADGCKPVGTDGFICE